MNRRQESIFSQMWLISSHAEKSNKRTFINPINPNSSQTHVMPKMRGKSCFGSFGKHLLLWDQKRKQCSFLNMTSMSKQGKDEIYLPPITVEFEFLGNFSVSSSLDQHDCIIFVFVFEGQNATFVLFCRQHDKEWTKLPVDFGDKYVGWRIMLHQDKLYTYSSGAVIVFDVPSLLTGNAEKWKFIEAPAPSHYPKMFFTRTHLIESCGDIFLVRTGTGGLYGPLIYMHIYRLNISSKEIWRRGDITISDKVWKRVHNIDDRSFCLDNTRGISVCAEDVGLQPNCVYYVLSCHGENRLCKLCLDDQTFTFNFLSDETRHESIFFGIAGGSIGWDGYGVCIFLWNPGMKEETWDMLVFENEVGVKLYPASSNPVFFHGEFYCLGETGCLGVFYPINRTWKVIHDMKPLNSEGISGTVDCYLLKLQGDLICVRKVNQNADISIFKSDGMV